MTTPYAIALGICIGALLSEGGVTFLAWSDRRRVHGGAHRLDDPLEEYREAGR